jgi:hypothetical protein
MTTTDKMKKILILKASKSICGEEIGMISNQCMLLGMVVEEKEIDSQEKLISIFNELYNANLEYDYLYLCTHGNSEGFEIDMGTGKETMEWYMFSSILCSNSILKENGIMLLACCKGGLFTVSAEIMAACNHISYICGVKWTVNSWDLATGFNVFIYSMEKKKSEPEYAAQKASLATDYTFVCYERTEIESNPQFINIKNDLFTRLGWIDYDGNWIEEDETIQQNVTWKK